MPKGRLQIRRISPPSERDVTYQVDMVPHEGGTFRGAVLKEHLGEFLHQKLMMDEESVRRVVGTVREKDRAELAEVELGASEMAGAGMEYLRDEG